MVVPKHPALVIDDLEATAELPVPDFTAGAELQVEALPESAVATDVFPLPAVPVGAAELADRLRDVEQRLELEMHRVQALEGELLAARVHGETLAEQLRAMYRREAPPHLQRELAELRRRCAAQLEALASWEGYRAVSQAQLDEALDALQAVEVPAIDGQTLPSPVATSHSADHQQLRDRIAQLEAELAAAREEGVAAEMRARLAAERVRRLESGAQASAALLDNLQQRLEGAGRQAVGSPELPADMVVRVLIREEAGSEVVYPLTRRTSVGRTPDNDIQVDTTFVSRHHAVLLSNPDHCIVEDLNSTNGVLVNGRRVGRQILHDGDMVTVGRTVFRYQQRS